MYNRLVSSLYLKILFVYFITTISILVAYNTKQYIKDSHLLSNIISSSINSPIKKDNLSSLDHPSVTITITKGNTLASILKSNGVALDEIYKVIESIKSVYNPAKLSVGQEVVLEFISANNNSYETATEEKRIYKLNLIRTKIDYNNQVEVYRKNNSEFVARITPITLNKYVVKAQGFINNSFAGSASKLGIPNKAIFDLIKVFSYDIDFQRDIKAGDKIEVLFERYYNDKGEYSHDGEVVFASLTSHEQKLNIYKFINDQGEVEYYNDSGNNIRKELLRTPLNVIRVSSSFGMRLHPILGFSVMHKGVDFAAPVGTPIFAAGDGIIEEMGSKGAYGNYIRLKHSNNMSTAYAHASSFAKKLKRGMKVKQGEVIAFVGTTGRSTGPHLHYEVLINNQHVNPLKIKVAPGKKLTNKELAIFQRYKKNIQNIAEDIPNKTALSQEVFNKKIKVRDI